MLINWLEGDAFLKSAEGLRVEQEATVIGGMRRRRHTWRALQKESALLDLDC